MSHHEAQQLNSLLNPQIWGQTGQQFGQGFGQQNFGLQGIGQNTGLGQAAFGQGGFGQGGYGMQTPWGLQQRQLTPQDTSEVVRQLLPLLPQIIAQAQQQQQQPPQAAFGYGGGFGQRNLTQQDVNEVVRQILPIVPQVIAQLQGQSPMQAVHGGHGYGQQQLGGIGQLGYGLAGNQGLQQPYASQQPWQQQQWPQMQAAMGGYQQNFGQGQRQLSQQDVTDVARQLVGILPQVIQSLQATGQQRTVC